MRGFVLGVVATVGLSVSAQAATITALNSNSVVGVAPAQVANSIYGNNDGITVGFNEASRVVLDSDMTLGGVDFAAGTALDSHLLYHDRFSGTEYITSMAAYSFSKTIAAVIVLTEELNATHSLFGLPETEYLSAYGWFGLEAHEQQEIVVTDTEVFARLTVNNGFDAVRVLTVAQVPLPAAGLLMLAGLGGMAATRRRKTA